MKERAKISEYLSHHHSSTRNASVSVFRPLLNAKFSSSPTVLSAEAKLELVERGKKIARRFEIVFLTKGPYVNGFSRPTIADLLAYVEIAQLEQVHLLNYSDMPILSQWLERMRIVKGHDDVHRTVLKLGELLK
jgi:glutathione S-transferase